MYLVLFFPFLTTKHVWMTDSENVPIKFENKVFLMNCQPVIG